MKCPCVDILANRRGGAMYVGVTSNLFGRISLHKQKLIPGFTKRYGVTRLVYYETHALMADAIAREKQLKRWQRPWKFRLIGQMNPEWADLIDETAGAIRAGPADVARFAAK